MEKHEANQLIAKSVLLSVFIMSLIGASAWFWFDDSFLAQQDGGPEYVGASAAEIVSAPSVADVVEKVNPAVVSVVISADVPVMEQYYEEFPSPPFDQFFGGGGGMMQIPRQRQVGTQQQEVGGGSGFLVSADGYIVTNRHVVDIDDASYSVTTNTGDSYDAKVVARDPSLDIAILKIEPKDGETFSYLTWGNSDELRLGEPVIAIGNALAEFPNSVSVGVVSGLSRNITAGDGGRFAEQLENVIQTDAAINRGNSGGPLLNARGEVIGVNVAVAGNSENIGFALPASVVEHVYDSVAQYGKIVRPFLGVRYMQITPEIAKQNNLSVDYGVLVLRGQDRSELAVMPGSAADKAGLEENDIILSIDGEKLDGSPSLATLLRQYQVGDTVRLTVLHDGQEKTVSVTLAEAPSE